MNPYEYVKNEPYKCYINGEFVIPEGGETFDVINRQIMSHLLKLIAQEKVKLTEQ